MGAQFLYESWTYEYVWFTSPSDKYKWIYSHSYITIFGAYYYDGLDIKGLKPFGKLQMGYYVASVKFESNDPTLVNIVGKQNAVSSFTYNFSVGARYFFRPNLSLIAEIGYGISVLTLGLDFGF